MEPAAKIVAAEPAEPAEPVEPTEPTEPDAPDGVPEGYDPDGVFRRAVSMLLVSARTLILIRWIRCRARRLVSRPLARDAG